MRVFQKSSGVNGIHANIVDAMKHYLKTIVRIENIGRGGGIKQKTN